MTYYQIDKDVRFIEVKDLHRERKQYLKITQIFWLVNGVEIDPYYIDCCYHTHCAVLVFLN